MAPAARSKRAHIDVETRSHEDAGPRKKSKGHGGKENVPDERSGEEDVNGKGNGRRREDAVFRSTQSSGLPSQTLHSEAERVSWLANDAADDDEANQLLASSTQDAAEGSENLRLYGDLATKIVGIRFYDGVASPGEYVHLRREPGNPYDSNAIRVDNVGGTQIGHMPRKVAEKLAKYLDHGWLRAEGAIDGLMGQFDCPLVVHMYGPAPESDEGKALMSRMAADKLPLKAIRDAEREEKAREKERQRREKQKLSEARRAAGAGRKGGADLALKNGEWASTSAPGIGGGEADMSAILEASQRLNVRFDAGDSEKYGVQEDDLEQMPEAARPAAIQTDMLPYQLQALAWLLSQEDLQVPPRGSRESVQLWMRHEKIQDAFANIATSYTTKDTPKFASGGILADDMGLGKTIEMISLIVADAEQCGRGTTLIVAPLSVMSNWSGQIAQHVKKSKALKVYVYHGGGRVRMQASDFAQYDVVITTYGTLASDYMPGGKGGKQPERKLRNTGLYSMDWRRIILDEGHVIRNPKSKGAAAATSLIGRSRWVLTGTPIVNSLKDLYSLLRFIGITGGLEQLDIFNSQLVRPLRHGDGEGAILLKAVMRAFCLRRRKDMKFIDLRLPELTEYIHRVEFTPKERERYDALSQEAKGLLVRYEKQSATTGGKSGAAYQSLLEVLLRMRQCCNHWQMCRERVTALLAQLEAQKTVDLTPENRRALQDMLQLQIESHEDCPVCLETLHDPVVTACGHYFGRECIQQVIDTQHKCPMCRAELKDETCLVERANECGDEDSADSDDDALDLQASSSKLEGLVKILHASKGDNNKTVVFSQWTRFLDIVGTRLATEGYKFCRIDGTMSAAQRDDALAALAHDPDTTILLASLGVCAVGLNLTAANQVILSDTWWAPAIEDQAVDRVHRLGQHRPTRVFRLVVDGSIEERTIDIQKDKRKLMMLAFNERSSKRDTSSRARLADLQKLLATSDESTSRGKRK